MSQILLVAQLNFITPDGPQVLGVSDAPYIDPDTDAGLFRGCYWPVIVGDVSWSEQARHSFQDQAPELSIGDIVLDNHSRLFDEWTGYTVSGLTMELRRGPASVGWADLEPVLIARMGQKRWSGRDSITIELKSVLEGLAEPFAREVFDEETPNPNLINTISPMLLGQCFQIRPALFDPAILRYVVADNMNIVLDVQEGGNPTENFEQIIQGFQLLQNPTLTITCDAAGPPPAVSDLEDVIEDIGGFEVFDSNGDPDGWDVRRDPPFSEITEDPDGALVESSAALDGDTGLIAADAVTTSGPTSFVPVGEATLQEAIASGGASYANVIGFGDNKTLSSLNLSGFDLDIGSSEHMVGLELEVDCENVGAGNNWADLLVTVRFPNGSFRVLGNLTGIPNTRTTLTIGEDRGLPLGVTAALIEDPASSIRITARRLTGGSNDVRIYAARLKGYTEPIFDRLRLRTIDPVMEPGGRYLVRIDHAGGTGDSIGVQFAGVTSDGEVAITSDPFSQQSGQLVSEGLFEATFVADHPHFAIVFDRGDGGNGEQLIRRIRVINQNLSLDRYNELIPYNVEHMGYDPAEFVDQPMIEEHNTATGNMPLGWYVANSASADQINFRLASSLGGPIWGGLDGRVRSFLMLPPIDPDNPDDFLILEDQQVGDDVEIWDDQPPNITDRAVGARNWHPIPEDRSAGITTTWTEQDKADVAAEWRVTRKAQFPDLDGFEPLPVDVLSVISVDPNSGPPEGGTEVTITGTGFEEGATVTFGGEPATNVVVVNSTTITCETPEEPD